MLPSQTLSKALRGADTHTHDRDGHHLSRQRELFHSRENSSCGMWRLGNIEVAILQLNTDAQPYQPKVPHYISMETGRMYSIIMEARSEAGSAHQHYTSTHMVHSVGKLLWECVREPGFHYKEKKEEKTSLRPSCFQKTHPIGS